MHRTVRTSALLPFVTAARSSFGVTLATKAYEFKRDWPSVCAPTGPPSPAAVAGVQATAAAAFLLLMNTALQRWQRGAAGGAQRDGAAATSRRRHDSDADDAGEAEELESQPLTGGRTRGGDGAGFGGAAGGASSLNLKDALNHTTDSLWWAGAEVGVWAFLANTGAA